MMKRMDEEVDGSAKLQLAAGTVLHGKWHGGRYEIERLLGEGANGQVYLVRHGSRHYALKIGADAADLQSEINVLRAIYGRTRSGSESFLVQVDDFTHASGRDYCFYMMQYIQGRILTDYLHREGSDWYALIGLNLLRQLGELHEEGWVFGDLKLENVLIASYGRVHLIDYGGVTAMGKSVRQFTELYDRGYWSAGSRRADPSYDLFSLAVLLIQAAEGAKLKRLAQERRRSVDALLALVAESMLMRPFKLWFQQALKGEFESAQEAASAWSAQHRSRSSFQRQRSSMRWLGGAFVASAIAAATAAIWYIQL